MDQINASLPLVFAYVLPLCLLVWLWLSVNIKSRTKLLLTLCLPVIYAVHWYGLQSLRGWPANQSLPNQFELIAADVVEPEASQNRDGKIHLWIRQKNNGEPRVYGLPYTRQLHKILFETKQRMEAGQIQMGRLYDASSNRGAAIGNNQKLEFQNATRAMLPPK